MLVANKCVSGFNSPIVRARLAIFSGDLLTAEECYVKRANKPDLAVDMYKQFNRWSDAIAVAERTDRASVGDLKQQYMDYLTSTGEKIIDRSYNLTFTKKM